MFLKSLMFAAALAVAPAAATITGFAGTAQAQTNGSGGQTGGQGGGIGGAEKVSGVVALAHVPDNQRRRPNDPPTVQRRGTQSSNLCALQHHSNGRMECAPY